MTINSIVLRLACPAEYTRPAEKKQPARRPEESTPWWEFRRHIDEPFSKSAETASITLITMAVKKIG